MSTPFSRFGRVSVCIAIIGAAMPGCSTLLGFEEGKPLGEGSGGQSTPFGGATAKGGTAPSHSGGVGGPSGGTTSSGGTTGANGGRPTSTGGTNQGGRNPSWSGGGPSSQGGDNPIAQGGEGGAGANGGAGGEAGSSGACTGCDIGGHCVREGSLNESNACLICDSVRNASAWSSRDGAACDDKVFCNGADICSAGSCSQHDGKDPCVANNDTCNATLDACCKTKLTNVCNASGNPVEVDSCGHEVRTLDACVKPNGSCVNGTCVCAAGWAGDDCSQCVRYVRAGASGIGDGKSWAQAVGSISDALAKWPTCQIWVYQGSYTPPSVTGTDPRAATFVIPAAARVYGGFSGGERSLAERDLSKHASILSGDIGVANDPSDNVYQVVTLGDAAVLDGFTVTGGNGSAASGTYTGSAVYGSGPSASIIRCELTEDLGAVDQSNIKVIDSALSGGVNLTRGSLAVTGCAFTKASVHGYRTRITVVGSTFVGPETGLYGNLGQVEVTQSSFSGGAVPMSADDLVLDHVTIESAETAVYVNKGTFSAIASTFRDNARIATMRDSQFRCEGCTFIGNRNGIQLTNASTNVTNSVFIGNSGTFTTLGADSSSRYTSCVFYDNDLSVDSTRPISIASSILWKNRTRPPVQVAVTYSDIDDPTTVDATNFTADPLFVSAAPGALDLRLRAGSPCIDRAPSGSPELDALGHARYDDPGTPNLNGTFADVGAYEWRPE